MRQSTILQSLLLLTTFLAGPALAQSANNTQHQIGLIDMAYVFKNYDKFTALTEALETEIASSTAEMKTKAQAGQKIQEQMKTFETGSAEYEKLEGDLLSLQGEIQKIQIKKRREFMRKEADLYKEIYLEATEAVGRYARYYNYTLILRFDRSGVTSAEDPQKIAKGMNQQVLYHRNRDDLTDPILNYLNDKWKKSLQEAKVPRGPATR